MEQGSPSKANVSSASPEFQHILWDTTFHDRINNSLSVFPVLTRMNLVHPFSFYLFKMCFNIFPSMLRSYKWSLFPQKPSMNFSSIILATCPAHLILYELMTNNFLWGVQVMNFPIIQFSLTFFTYCRLDPNVFLNNWVTNAPLPLLFSERERDELPDPYEI